MIRKIGMFFLSLWLLFFLIIIITIQIPTYFGKDWVFVGVSNLLTDNMIPIVCIFALIAGSISYLDFIFQSKGSRQFPFKISKVEKIDYEHLTFLTTYIVPLVCFKFDSFRYLAVFFIILLVIGIIYIRTDLFYANPTLAILKYKIYRINGDFRNGKSRENIILISKSYIKEGDMVQYKKLDERIYYAFKEDDNAKDRP